MFNKKETKNFDFKMLNNINIGSLEGENDNCLQEDTFIITMPIYKILADNKYNYIIGSFGSGKSALFKAIQEKYITSKYKELNEKFFADKNIICLNESFHLDSHLYKSEFSLQFIILNWSIYLLKILISDILENHKDKKNFIEFKKNISLYEELKGDFKLHDFKDWLQSTSINPTITVSGTPISLNLNLKLPSQKKELNLNQIYKLINNFYEKNGLNCWILIDRIDDFVRFDNYNKRSIYIQGLHEVIEELRKFSCLRPMLFLREDLFESINFTTGNMKVKDRTIYLTWTPEEILNFIFRRVIKQKAFRIYYKDLNKIIASNTEMSTYNKIKNIILDLSIKLKLRKKKKYNSFEHKVVKELLYFILPPIVKLNTKEMEFEDMLKQFLIDEDFINPRIFITFMNKLNEEQYIFYSKNPPSISNKKLGHIRKIKDYNTINVYTNICIKQALNYTKSSLLDHIQGLFPDENINFKKCFFNLNNNFLSKNVLIEEEIFNLLKKESLNIQQIKFIIHYLQVVKYFYKKGKKYTISNVYKKA